MSTQPIAGVTQSNSVTSLSSTTPAPASGFRQNLRGLESALLNGDVSTAQDSLAALQQSAANVQGSANSVPSLLVQPGSTLNQDLQSVSGALSSGDVGAAQKAFAKLQQDMDTQFQAKAGGGAGHAHGHHGHHAHAVSSTDADATQPTDAAANAQPNDLLSALQSLANANPKVAGDLGNLIGDLGATGTAVNAKA